MSQGERYWIARDALAACRVHAPLAVARALGFRLLIDVGVDACESTSDLVVCPWSRDPVDAGWRAYHAIAHGLLARRGAPHNHVDVILLGCCLAMPIGSRHDTGDPLPRHAPTWAWVAWIEHVHRTGFRPPRRTRSGRLILR